MRIRSAKKIHRIILFVLCLLVLLLTAFFIAYRYVRVGGRIFKVNAKEDQGFYSEYYLFIPDSLKTSGRTFLLVEPNNTGFVDDDHRTHVDAAYDIIRFG